MYKIATINKISQAGIDEFNDKYTVSDEILGSTGIIVRSQDLNSMEFHRELLAISRAGAGVNNIPIERCADDGIVVFNAPGANANAVKELVICGLVMAARHIPASLKWASSLEATEDATISQQVEKGKSKFAGREIMGKTLGIIGLGAIGQLVANSAMDLGMKVIGFDPFLTVQKALKMNPKIEVVSSYDKVLEESDYVSIHIPVMDETKGSINKTFFSFMKEGAVLLNFSRDKLINEDDLVEALNQNLISTYVTDFPSDKLYARKDVITIPHLGASTKEAEDNCAIMAARELMDYIECGNITNSVNFPNVSLGPLDDFNRVAVLTKNEPNPVKLALAMFADKKIAAVAGGVKGKYGYALLATNDMIIDVPKVECVIKVRVIQDL